MLSLNGFSAAELSALGHLPNYIPAYNNEIANQDYVQAFGYLQDLIVVLGHLPHTTNPVDISARYKLYNLIMPAAVALSNGIRAHQ